MVLIHESHQILTSRFSHHLKLTVGTVLTLFSINLAISQSDKTTTPGFVVVKRESKD